MQSEDKEVLLCKICSKIDPLCSTKLGIAICAICWKDKKPHGNSYFTWSPEIDKITDKIYLGNEETQKRKLVLKALGITHILVMGSGLDIHYPKDFTYKKIEIDDFYSENIAKYFEETYQFIEEAEGKVYVHCAAGISRSASIVIAYIMRKMGKNFEEAMDFVKEKRNCVSPNYGFVKQLCEFEKHLGERQKL